MNRVLLASILAGVAFVATAQPAAAQDKALAERFYKLGKELYLRSDYDGALKNFMESYKYSKLPALLFNIARCHESLGHYDQAIEFFKKYQASLKTPDAKITARITNLQKLAKRKHDSEAKRKAELDRLRKEADKRRAEEERLRKLREHKQKQRQADKRSIHSGSLPGWLVAGGGVALIGAGVIFGALASSKASDLEAAALANEEYDANKSAENQGKAFNAIAITGLIVGGAAAVTGGVLLFLHYRKAGAERRTAWIAPAPLPGGGIVSAGLRF